eukprot:scaffold197572_cov23-Prasinocladus_malaysianus.AAC.1
MDGWEFANAHDKGEKTPVSSLECHMRDPMPASSVMDRHHGCLGATSGFRLFTEKMDSSREQT